eukprot:TRINITY_DN28576_c0_g1_i1.p1 TRINITY_DN28576_c0_g1~~TRINITY_DN28576_c0_g1_i1.p1  ORF type:complete len:219 (-),score=32.88 TRINITY_DN28576_c0_g1_i1:7-615(-)
MESSDRPEEEGETESSFTYRVPHTEQVFFVPDQENIKLTYRTSNLRRVSLVSSLLTVFWATTVTVRYNFSLIVLVTTIINLAVNLWVLSRLSIFPTKTIITSNEISELSWFNILSFFTSVVVLNHYMGGIHSPLLFFLYLTPVWVFQLVDKSRPLVVLACVICLHFFFLIVQSISVSSCLSITFSILLSLCHTCFLCSRTLR